MELAGCRTDLRGEGRFNEGMNIFVRSGLHLLGTIFGKDLFEALIDGLPFLLREDAATQQRACVRAAGADIDVKEDGVDAERPVHLFENRVAFLLKPSLP